MQNRLQNQPREHGQGVRKSGENCVSVEQLGELVDAEPANDASNPGNPAVIPARLARTVRIGLIREHGPEFQDLEMSPVEPLTYLPEEDRAAALQFYRDRGKGQQGRGNGQGQHGNDDVLAAFDPALPAGNGTNARLEGEAAEPRHLRVSDQQRQEPDDRARCGERRVPPRIDRAERPSFGEIFKPGGI